MLHFLVQNSSLVKLLTDLLPFLAIVGGALMLRGVVTKGALETQALVITTQKDANDELKKEIDRLKSSNRDRDAAFKMQDSRLLRLEIENEGKNRQIKAEQQANEMLEKAVQLALNALQRAQMSEAQEVARILAELREFRRKCSQEYEQWESATRLELVYSARSPEEPAHDSLIGQIMKRRRHGGEEEEEGKEG